MLNTEIAPSPREVEWIAGDGDKGRRGASRTAAVVRVVARAIVRGRRVERGAKEDERRDVSRDRSGGGDLFRALYTRVRWSDAPSTLEVDDDERTAVDRSRKSVCREMRRGGTVALVTPQNWLFFGTSRAMREQLLASATIVAITTHSSERALSAT